MPKLSMWPLGGYRNSAPRAEIPITQLTGKSVNWLVGRQRLRRRAGSAIFGDTLAGGVEVAGILESRWSALARRMLSAKLPGNTNGFPASLLLYVNESVRRATLAFRSTNGGGSWRTVGKEFSAHHYPNAAVPNHRVVPMVYRNEHGGLTLHRLNTAEYRSHMCEGSRSMIQTAGKVAWPSPPHHWDGNFNDDPSSGAVAYHVFPTGLIPPLQMPTCAPGKDLGAAPAFGPWKGSQAWYFSQCFENEHGELSWYAIPKAPNSAWSGYPGFGYVQVDAANPTNFKDSMVYSGIAQGPPGTRWIHLFRSSLVDTASTGVGAITQPAQDNLQFFAKIPQGQTTYVDTKGNDDALDLDFRIGEMLSGGLQWPASAKDVGTFDGRLSIGNARVTNPYALIVAPWLNGDANLKIDDAGLYGATAYFVAVTPTAIVLRSVTAGTPTDVSISLGGRSLDSVITLLSSGYTETDVSHTATDYYNTYWIFKYGRLYPGMKLSGVVTDVVVGSDVVGADWLPGTKAGVSEASGGNTLVYTDRPAVATVTAGSKTIHFISRDLDTANPAPWAAAAVPGADVLEAAESLLRTRVVSAGVITNNSDTVTSVTAADLPYISPGMLTNNSRFAAGTIVIAVGASSVQMSAKAGSSSTGSETIKFGYDTGDTMLATDIGFVRTFGNAFPVLLPWSLAYLDRFTDDEQKHNFSVGSPGYPQNGLNTWMERNKGRGPDELGAFMGMAPIGPVEIHFYEKGYARLWNPRTGLTRADADYTETVISWAQGCSCPFSICSGNGWSIYASAEGIFGIGVQMQASPYTGTTMIQDEGNHRLSDNLYDPGRPVGERGELEYALEACAASAASGGSHYPLACQVINGRLRVRYWSSLAAGTFDREIIYDFSASQSRSGLAALLQNDGSAYPWSAPLTYRHAVSAIVPAANGLHHYAALDTNAGTADGRVDEIDVGTLDNGVQVRAVGYSGVKWPAGLGKIYSTIVRALFRNPGTGLSIAITREPESDPETAHWDALAIGSTGPDDFGRGIATFKGNAASPKIALGVRVLDDGSGECPDLSLVEFEATELEWTKEETL